MNGKFMDLLGDAISKTEGESAFRSDPHRPYDGQPHTLFGERGRLVVKGLTVRDIADCFFRALLFSADPDDPHRKTIEAIKRYEYVHTDVYKIDASHIDFVAVAQNMVVEIERAMRHAWPGLSQELERDE